MLNRKDNMAFIIGHYHEEGKLPKHLLEHVKYIKKFSDQIIFVSTKLSPIYIKQLKPHATVIVRPNRGYDFYSYKTGLALLEKTSNLEHLIFFNSSFITLDPKKLYKKYFAGVKGNGLYGITSCNAISYHIQSYFFSFKGKSLISSQVFNAWWNNVKIQNSKSKIIKMYEIGMSVWFEKNKILLRSVFKINSKNKLSLILSYIRVVVDNFQLSKVINFIFIQKRTGYNNLNATHFLWEEIFTTFSIIKIDLLINNPTKRKLPNFDMFFNFKQLNLVKDALS
jgi:rhamnosyltransferase